VEAIIAERKEYIKRIIRFKSAKGINDKLLAPLNNENYII
jgi:hypothetical protein